MYNEKSLVPETFIEKTMSQLPFEIPKSLGSYAKHFEDDPIRAITRLKKQLKKRGPDAVGYFLLSWFYHLKNMNDQAVEEALKARIYAPGSPLFRKLHYYLSHPDTFEAWTPDSSRRPSRKRTSSSGQPGPVFDLDDLIQKLSNVESTRIRPEKEMLSEGSQEADSSDDVDNIVTETLAKIHERQGKRKAAITTYKRLQHLHPEKKGYYRQQISRLESATDE